MTIRTKRTNPKSDWYIWRDAKADGSAPNNWRGIFGGSAWTWCEERQQYYLHTFADFQPDLNWENPEVRQALYDIANYWKDKGVGGFRLDAVTYIKKPASFADGEADGKDGLAGIHKMTANSDGILSFLHEFKQKVQDGYDIFTVGEANGVPNSQLDEWVGEKGVFDMIFNFDLVDIQFPNGEEYWYKAKDFSNKKLKETIVAMQTSCNESSWCPVFLENHDQPRSVSHYFPHCRENPKAAKTLGMLLETLRGTPFVYQGEELGMTNVNRDSIEEYDDISSHNQYKTAMQNGLSPAQALSCVQRFSRDNARSPMQWDDTLNAGFSTCRKPWLPIAKNYKTINAEIESADSNSVLSWYRALCKLRMENPELLDGSFEELLKDDENIFAYRRSNSVIIMVNLSDSETRYNPNLVENCKLLLSSEKDSRPGVLKPFEAVCYKENPKE